MGKILPKVLMLGWEFPPIINGGLGVACHDLSSAMSHLADITMVIPRSSPGFRMKNMNLVGLNTLDIEAFSRYAAPESMPFKIQSIASDLNPYYSVQEDLKNDLQKNIVSKEIREKLRQFNIENLYEGDVIGKVLQFAEIATAYAATLDFDIIHAHDWMTMIAGIKIKQLTGKPLIIHIHSLEVDRSGEESKGWVYELEKRGMEFADMLMPVSHYTADNIQKYYGINKNKMAVIHNGTHKVRPFKSRRHFKEKTVLFVGRLTRQKGPEKFLDIAEKVLQKNPDVRFVMAGVGDYFKRLIEKSSYKCIGNRFHMTGFLNLEKLNYLFSVSDVYCMPSLSEPFGLSAVEAAQFGIPCVISKQSGVSEVLKGSLKFDFWDVDRAAGCILNVINDQLLREKMIEDAKRDLEHISWDIAAKKVVAAYNDACLN